VRVCWLLLAFSGQIGSSALTGIVRDPAGAAVPGAAIVVTDLATNASRTIVATPDGVYTAAGLTPGLYRLEVHVTGFRPLRRDGIRLATGETVRFDVDLAIGAVQERVAVRGDAPILRRERAGLGRFVEHEIVVGLPLNGRSFITLAALAPGVALPPGSQLPRINGGRPRTNEYLFDGISVLQPEPGQIAFFPIVDAIQEFKVETNSPPAEFGRFNGGVVNLTTRAGTNRVQGSAFEFARHQRLNARNLFAAATAVKPEYRRHQFGAVLGGPIVPDHTFFFADYQGQRQTIGRTVISTVPTLLQRQGIFTEAIGGRLPAIYDPATTAPAADGGLIRLPFVNGVIPAARLDPVAASLLQRYPLPTTAGTANNYRRTDVETDDQDQFDVRIDHRWSPHADQVFARLSYVNGRFIPVTPLPDGSGVTSGTLGPQRTTASALATGYQRAFSGRWLNELRAGDTRRRVGRTAARLPAGASSSLRIPGIPATARFPETLPTFLVAGYQQLGSPANTASDFSTSVTELADSLTWLKGRHTIKAGFDWRWQRLNVIQPPSPTGSFTFTSLFTDLPGVANTGTTLASFLLGQVQTFSIDLQQQPIRNRARFQEYFVQDDWKIADRITLNAGTRYTLNFPSTEMNDQAAVFNLQTLRLDYLGQDGNPRSARRLHWLNFGPRLGVVARLGERTVLSSGYGVVWIEQAGITTPFTTPVFPFLQTVSQRTLDNLAPAFALGDGPTVAPIPLTPAAGLGQGVFAVDADLGSGYVQQWNVALQRELTANTVVDAAYIGSKIIRVGIPDSNLNQLTVEQLALGSSLLQRVPNPYFGIVPSSSSLGGPTISVAQLLKPYPQYTSVSLYRHNVGTTAYHGLTVGLRRRLSRGVTYSASYTRSSLVDDASSVFDASILTGPVANYPVADSFHRARERDRSTGDIPHLFVASVVWTARGWTLAALATLQSGAPVAVTQATNFNAFAGFGVQRPSLVGDPRLPADQRTTDRWFNTDAFAVAPQFTIGSAMRNPVRGPSYRNLDLAIVRRVPLWRGSVVEIRGEVFNALNTPPLEPPNAVLGAANFGSITSAGDPRVVQLAVKLVF
jgi:hypothetical protein